MRLSCYQCGGSGLVCEQHPHAPAGHDHCDGLEIPCDRCNRELRPLADERRSGSAPHRRAAPPRDIESGKFTGRRRSDPKPFDDSFDYGTLWGLLARLTQSHRVATFADCLERLPPDPFVILRHDVDYSLYSALTLAREEAARGIRATYFLLVNSAYYNLLSPSHAHVPGELIALGHHVGLHYDVNFFRPFPEARWEQLLDTQVRLLEELCGSRVSAIAMHQPALNGDDPFRGSTRYLNASSDRFVKDTSYLSDSCRAWRDATWRLLRGDTLPPRLQLGLHPINWAPTDRDRVTIFKTLHEDLASAVILQGEELLAKIAEHQAVLEHNARSSRS
jgi:hypothetical protein